MHSEPQTDGKRKISWFRVIATIWTVFGLLPIIHARISGKLTCIDPEIITLTLIFFGAPTLNKTVFQAAHKNGITIESGGEKK